MQCEHTLHQLCQSNHLNLSMVFGIFSLKGWLKKTTEDRVSIYFVVFKCNQMLYWYRYLWQFPWYESMRGKINMKKLSSIFEKPLFLVSISLSRDHILSLRSSFDNTRLIHHLCGRIFTNIVVVVSAIRENSKEWQNVNMWTLANIRFPF